MTNDRMALDTVTLRSATLSDAAALSELVVELYQTELPGSLHSPRSSQLQLFRYLVEHELNVGGSAGRFLAVDEAGLVVGTASVRMAGDVVLSSLPPKLFSVCLSSIGLVDTARLFGALLRSSFSADPPLRLGECFVYSVIVSKQARGRGVGSAMMAQVEAFAYQAGAQLALLRVIAGNQRARDFYLRLGYQFVSHTPPWIAWLGVPSDLLRKELRSSF